MAHILSPTSRTMPGPWILDAVNLRNLDTLIDKCVERMREKWKDDVEQEIARRLAELPPSGERNKFQEADAERIPKFVPQLSPYSIDRRRLTVYMSGGRTASGETFEDLNSLAGVASEMPNGFALRVEVGRSEIRMDLKPDYGNRPLIFEASSDQPSFSEEIFGRIENWASELKPPNWLQKWLVIREYGGAPLLLLLIFGLAVAPALMLKTKAAPSATHQQAWEMAQRGVDAANERQAIQLILALESGYEPSPTPSISDAPSGRFWVLYGVVALLLVVVQFPPKGSIGMWAGHYACRRQRAWIGFLSVTVPLMVAAALVSEVLQALRR